MIDTEKQRKKDEYYLGIAEAVAIKSSCMRRLYGAIIVKNDEIIATGYNGSPRGCLNCNELGCIREAFGTKKGDAYNLCASVHAEQNAIISAARRDMIGATMYIVGINVSRHYNFGKTNVTHYADPSPCLLCHRMIINAGIARVVGLQEDDTIPEGHRIVEIDVTGHTLMNKIQQEYYDLLHSQQAEFEISKAYHGDDMTPKEIDDESNRLRRIETLINMRQLMVDNRADEVNQEEALALMRELRGDAE